MPTLGASRDSDGRTAGGAAARGDPTSVLPQPSRAERLAYELQRDTAQSETRSRAVAMAAATSPGRQTALVFEDRPRLGDTYRRPAVSARRVEPAR